jgi:hypothetical protein
MAKTANELLQGILTTVGAIDKRMAKDERTGLGRPGAGLRDVFNIAVSLVSFGKVKDTTKKSFISFMKDVSEIVKDDKGKNFEYFSEGLIKISTALPDLVKSLDELGKMKTKRVDSALDTLRRLYDFMHDVGDGRSVGRVERGIKLFDQLGKSLQRIAQPLRSIASFLLILGVSIVAFAASLLLTGMILKLASPKDALLFVGFTILSLVLLFGIIALAGRVVTKGTGVIKDIGWGMVALALGILSFAITLRVLPMILGPETGGSIAKSLLIMLGIVVAAVLMFTAIGLASEWIKRGTGVIFMMSLGMLALSVAMVGMGMAAKFLQGATIGGAKDEEGKERDDNKKMILRGLGTFGLIFLASAAAFALLGIPVVAGLVITGIAVSIAMSAALILLAISISKLSKTARELEKENIGKQIAFLVGGTIEGMIEGFGSLAGGQKGIRGIAQFLKNSAMIFAGTGVLMAMSVALSQFAKAISAFAELESMRIIEGYDEKTGKPIFGEKVNISKVADNISYSISTFLTALIESTDGLTRKQVGAIRKMGRALTGRRGILSAVIQFADALKVYSEFGEKNEIGYLTYDDKGNETTKYVDANTVVSNMISSFLYFSNSLFTKSEEEFGDGEEAGITGRQKRRMRRMSKALTGRHGILGAVMEFAETLKMFSEFGANNEIPILDKDGNPTGKTLTVNKIADNIVKTLTVFSDTLADKLEKGQIKDASKALKKYDDMIDKLKKLSDSMDGLTRLSLSITELGEGIGLLATNLNKLDTTKLKDLSTVSAAYLEKTNAFATSNKRIAEKTTASNTRPTFTSLETVGEGTQTSTTVVNAPGKETPPTDWQNIAQQIGDVVGTRVAGALKGGVFVFEFDTTKSGIYHWSPG